MRLTATIAAAALMMGATAASARADTYAWTAGQDSGTFTTGAASPVGAGYFLLTDFFFAIADAGSYVFTNQDVTSFLFNASFNPTIDGFGNNYNGKFYNDTSGVDNDAISVDRIAVGDYIIIRDNDPQNGESALSTDVFTVVAGLPTPPTPAAPEPSTWALLFAGVGLAGLALRSRKPVVMSAA